MWACRRITNKWDGPAREVDLETTEFDIAARYACMDMLRERFGIGTALVSVPKLARVLGFARSTLYARIKAGNFFIEHRMIGDAPMVTLDALVDWYLWGGAQPRAAISKLDDETMCAHATANMESERESDEKRNASRKRSRDRKVDDLVARAVDAVGKGVKSQISEPEAEVLQRWV